MITNFKYDVFISYSSNDKEWVRSELLSQIENAGLKAFIDFRDFIRGAPSIKEMERGVKECRKTLLVLTPAYNESEWCEIENIMSQTLDPANRELRLIPLLKAPCEKPLRISTFTHIDFTENADRNLAWRQLLISLGKLPESEQDIEIKRSDWHLAHPYPMPPNFTGRKSERAMLTRWLNEDTSHPMFIVRALGGFGKSALTWHWLLNDVVPNEWPKVIWWSFYEEDTSFDNFLTNTLKYLIADKAGLQSLSSHDKLEPLLKILNKKGTLLILDGFERALRAFGGFNAAYQGDDATEHELNNSDCISPHAEYFLRSVAVLPDIQAKILITTRLRPKSIENHGALLNGCREIELLQLQPDDAIAFFQSQGIRGTHTEIEVECERYGFHPLSLSLLAGLIINDLQQAGDIAVAKRLDVSGDLIQRKHHVLESSYNSLSSVQRKLLSNIACFRSPIGYETLKELTKEYINNLDLDLTCLVSHGLLYRDKNRFDLHPIVRRYAYDRLNPRKRAAAHNLFRDYFAAIPKVDKPSCLEDISPLIELYHHTVRAGEYEEAFKLFKDQISKITYYQLGAYQLRIDLLEALFPDGLENLPRLNNERFQCFAMNSLSNSYSASGQIQSAIQLGKTSCRIAQKFEDKKSYAVNLLNLADDQLTLGLFQTAEFNERSVIDIFSKIDNVSQDTGFGRQELCRLLSYRGAYEESKSELIKALALFEKHKNLQMQSVNWSYRTQLELICLRSNINSVYGNPESVLKSAQCALGLVDKVSHETHPNELDYIRIYWLLGAAYRINDKYSQAEIQLNTALERSRRINCIRFEADILIELARLNIAMNLPEEAKRLAEEALAITERCGYVLIGADAQLELAKLSYAKGDNHTTKIHAQKAKELAICDGPPDYTYKVAYDEAIALLAKTDEIKFK